MDAQRIVVESVVLRLSKRQQMWGAVAVLTVALLYAFVLPLIGKALEGDQGFSTGEVFNTGGGVSVVPAEGWSLESTGELFTTLSNGPARMAMLSAAPITEPPSEIIEATIARLENDTDRQWVIGDPETYTSPAGYHVTAVEAHSTDTAQRVWVIDDGTITTTLIGTAPEDLWVSYEESMEDMAMSVRFTGVS